MLSVYFAQKAFIWHGGHLLAVRRSEADEHHPLKWEVPGGRLDKGEGVDAHLVREVFEEVGIQVAPGQPFFVWSWEIRPAGVGLPTTVVAVARICSPLTFNLSSDGRVAGDNLDLTQWIPLSEIPTVEWIPNMLPVVESFLDRVSR